MTEPLVLGLGGNLGGDDAILDRFLRARAALSAWGAVRGSTVVRSSPVAGPGPDYLNAALAIALDPQAPAPGELIAAVLALERGLGRDRTRGVRNGARTIDLDILWWGDREVRHDDLEVPHPRLHQRRFALEPLIELVGDAVVVRGASLRAHLAAVADQRVTPTAYRI